MSIDINWEAATSGPDGEALAERIRLFIHDKFQQIALPRFIRSVEVNSFDFGNISPELQIRDLCDPYPDFYEEDEDGELSDGSGEHSPNSSSNDNNHGNKSAGKNGPGESGNLNNSWRPDNRSYLDARIHGSGVGLHSDIPIPSTEAADFPSFRSPINFGESLNPYFFPRSGTPGVPGGTSNLGYYRPAGGLSGTQTPLTSVARGALADGWRESSLRATSPTRNVAGLPTRRQSDIDIDSSTSRPSTSDTSPHLDGNIPTRANTIEESAPSPALLPPQDEIPRGRMRERRPDDMQVFCRIQYSGNMNLSLTAQILLDYPMPNFAGLPLKLNITGFTFDGVAVIAYIRKRVHFCFLAPEDADALLGADGRGLNEDDHPSIGRMGSSPSSPRRRDESLLREIRVESEIGRKETGKQVLKNVGKVEKFVLQQVRRIFEEEFVYPSFWTFLI